MQSIKNEYIPELKERLKKEIAGEDLRLVIVQVGHVAASDRYVRNKKRDCDEVGLGCQVLNLPETLSEQELLEVVGRLNGDPSVTGFIVQLPLPKGISEEKIRLAISPEKDADGFNPLSVTVPATPLGVYDYLKAQGFGFVGKNCLVIGRSEIVGKPMAKLLVEAHANVTVITSATAEYDKRYYIGNADLIVVAAGHRHTLTAEYPYKRSAVVIDVGINLDENGRLCGDCDKDLPVGFQSPVPGGVGLLTRESLISNLITLKRAARH